LRSTRTQTDVYRRSGRSHKKKYYLAGPRKKCKKTRDVDPDRLKFEKGELLTANRLSGRGFNKKKTLKEELKKSCPLKKKGSASFRQKSRTQPMPEKFSDEKEYPQRKIIHKKPKEERG